MYSSALAIVIVVFPISRSDKSWLGKMIFLKEGGVEIINGKTDDDGTQVPVATLDGLSYRVEAVDGDWVRVRFNGIPGWFPKHKAVLSTEAVEFFTRAIALNPRDPELYNRRSEVWKFEGKYDSAIADLTEAVRLTPNQTAYHNNRAQAYFGKRDYERAIADFSEAIRLDPMCIRAYDGRGSAYFWRKEYTRAVKDLEEAVRINPEFASAANNLAWLRATCQDGKLRDGKQALRLATKCCELTNWKDGGLLDTLAAAYAELGQFDKAVEWQERSLEGSRTERGDPDGRRARLRLYQRKQPFRDSPDAS
jgi:tetratricopeptide (TPR) repeat protein